MSSRTPRKASAAVCRVFPVRSFLTCLASCGSRLRYGSASRERTGDAGVRSRGQAGSRPALQQPATTSGPTGKPSRQRAHEPHDAILKGLRPGRLGKVPANEDPDEEHDEGVHEPLPVRPLRLTQLHATGERP